MRPPLLTEQAIREAITEVAASGRTVTGVAVRAVLAKRHGARGGVSRIYRLLRLSATEARDRTVRRVTAPRAAASEESREAAIERANLSEHRERVHQERWARETDVLRSRLAAAEEAVHDADVAAKRITELTRALASAQARIADLEQQLLARD